MTNTAEKIEIWPTETMPLDVFCAVYNKPRGTIYSYKSRQQWKEGREFCIDPLGHIHIILQGYDKWVLSKSNIQPAPVRTATASRSASNRRVIKKTAMKRSVGNLPQLT